MTTSRWPDTELAKRIREARIDADLYQWEVANKLGVRESHYGLWERAAVRPSVENLLKLCDLYGWDELEAIALLRRTPTSGRGSRKRKTTLPEDVNRAATELARAHLESRKRPPAKSKRPPTTRQQ